MKKYLLLSCLIVFIGCQSADKSSEEKGHDASTTEARMVVAVLPTMDAIPLYYAVESGLADSLGLRLQLIDVGSEFDANTLLAQKKADAAMSDLVRTMYYRQKGQRVKMIAMLQNEAGIAVSRALRIKKLGQLDERTLAVERFSMLDLLREQAQLAVKLPYDRTLPAQINAYALRAKMLDENQIDAAVLPQPFLETARLAGHAVVTDKPLKVYSCLAVSDSLISKRSKELRQLLKVYNASVKALNARPNAIILSRIGERLHYAPEVKSWVMRYKYHAVQNPNSLMLAEVSAYMERRKAGRHVATAELYTTELLP